MSHTLDVVPGSVEVTGLVPNTLYTVALRLSFEGGGLGPAVQRQITTHEDGEEEERGTEGEGRGGWERGGEEESEWVGEGRCVGGPTLCYCSTRKLSLPSVVFTVQ